MSFKKYYITATLLSLLLSPIAASIGLIGVWLVFPPILTLSLVWVLQAKIAMSPTKASEIFFPMFLSFCYYMCVWIIIFGLSGYRFNSALFGNAFFLLTAPYFVINAILTIGGGFGLFPAANLAIFAVTVLTVIITRKICKKKIIYDKKLMVYGLILICLCGVAGFFHYERSIKIIGEDYQAERIEDEIELYLYRPFSKNNLLKRLGGTATLAFDKDYPKLDGATAAYPVYAAIAQELYKGLDEETVRQYVACSKTAEAYSRLTRGEIDIFFGAQPSKQQIEAAKENGVELVLTHIAKEAFVFFVNKNNPVGNLTIEQIQDIYQKKITNWADVGGKNEKITPFQRPENSGSQTIMLDFVMSEKLLPAPLWEEYAAGMGGMISQVATYRNYSSSIGYSFRYFATGMKPNENIRLLSIDDMAPTIENIRTGDYPFTVDVYAVTAGPISDNAKQLIDWILSEHGQAFIELCGYVRYF